MEAWQEVKLREVCLKIGSGSTPRGGKEVYLDAGDVTLILSQNIYNDRFNPNGLVFILPKHAQELKNVEILEEDILLNITGDSVARSCQVPKEILPARVNQHVAIIRPNPSQLNPRFLRFYLVSPQMQSHMLGLAASGATRNALTKEMIENFLVPCPPMREQQSIAALLGALDDKIDLNRRTNQTLEAMARALFKDWFVDFGPTRAKQAGKPAYLAPELWALFPSRIDPTTGLPEGWEEKPIGQEVEVFGGGTPSTKDLSFWDGDIHWTTPKDLSSLQFPVLLNTGRKITESGLSKISSGLLPIGTVLLSSRAPIGYLAITQIPVAINQGFIAMVCKKRLSNIFILLWCENNSEAIVSNANGSTFQEISKTNFRPLPVVVPTDEILLEPIRLNTVS